MTHDKFIYDYRWEYVDFDGKYGFQCVDLMRKYIQKVKVWNPYSAVPAGPNAKSIFLNFKDNAYYRKVLNGPTNAPKQGDIVFWGTYPFVTGFAGHVAICHSSTPMRLVTFDQNYPTGRFCDYVNHSYEGVMGWLTPRK